MRRLALLVLLCVGVGGVWGEGEVVVVEGEEVRDGTADLSPSSVGTGTGAEHQDFFVPTNEWQSIKPGQRVPSGLHYRMNLQTGTQEAKLLPDSNPDNYKHIRHVGQPKGPINVNQKYFSVSELEKALKDLNDKKPTEVEKEDSKFGEPILDFPLEEDEEEIKQKFKSYEQLKKDFKSMNIVVKTDLEIIKGLLAEYNFANSSTGIRLSILEDIEYYVHQIDNAQTFVDLGGLQILKKALNNSDIEFRQMASFIVGSAAQSNPKVQVAVVDEGILHHLVRVFNIESSPVVRKKYIYAISSILRHFPFAQRKFLDLGGIEALGDMFAREGNEKQKVKIVTLFFDLATEKKHYESLALRDLPDSVDKERLKQYRNVPLLETLIEKGWCSFLPSLLRVEDWDSQEKVLSAMELMWEDCRREFVRSRPLLTALRTQFQNTLNADSGNDYLQSLLDTLNQMLDRWNEKVDL